MDLEARKIISKLQEKYPRTYLVGGAVRDLLLNKKHFDLDLATEATPSEIKRSLKSLGVRFFDVGEKFGTIGLVLKSGINLEITTFRKESVYSDLRHPDEVLFVKDPKEDAKRRDFTMNSLFYDLKSRKILDFTGGLPDLRNKKIKFVGFVKNRITEDPLRMLRAVRFAATLNFKIAGNDFREIKKHSKLINKISAERVKAELDKIFSSQDYLRGIEILDQSGLLKEIFPELDALKKVRQSKDFHSEGNAFIHTLRVIEKMRKEDLLMRYCGLFHDIGKIKTAKIVRRDSKKHISFYGHAQAGAELFNHIARRLKFPGREKAYISYMILKHMDLIASDLIQQEKIIKMAQNPHFLDLIKLRIYDNLGSYADSKHQKMKLDEIRQLKELSRKVLIWQKRLQNIPLDGDDVLRLRNMKAGKKVGEILELLRIQIASGKIKDRKQAEKFVKTLDK